LDVGKDLVPQPKAEINDGRWPEPPSPRLKLKFVNFAKKLLLTVAAGERINTDVHLKLLEVASDSPVL
jgi:hypothetical protein